MESRWDSADGVLEARHAQTPRVVAVVVFGLEHAQWATGAYGFW